MTIRKLASLMAIAALGLLALGAASASASTALRTDPGGALLTGSTTLTNTTADPAVLTMPSVGTITCNQTFFDADVTRNASTSSISGTLTNLTFTSCTDTILGIDIPDCTLSPTSPFPAVSIVGTSAAGGTVSLSDPTIRCATSPNLGFCYYTPHTVPTGNFLNSNSSLTYSVTGVTAVAGSNSLGAFCGGAAGTFNTTLTHVVQGGTNRTMTLTTS